MRKHPTQGISCVTQTLHQALFTASLSCLESPCVILHWEGGAETYRMTEYTEGFDHDPSLSDQHAAPLPHGQTGLLTNHPTSFLALAHPPAGPTLVNCFRS